MTTVSLKTDVDCSGSPNLQTELLLWTIALPCLCQEYFKSQMTFSYLLLWTINQYPNTGCIAAVCEPSKTRLRTTICKSSNSTHQERNCHSQVLRECVCPSFTTSHHIVTPIIPSILITALQHMVRFQTRTNFNFNWSENHLRVFNFQRPKLF